MISSNFTDKNFIREKDRILEAPLNDVNNINLTAGYFFATVK